MARTSDPHSATAQFFINVADNDFLEPHGAERRRAGATACSARSSAGTDVVDKIKGVKTGNSGCHQDVPADDVVIEKAEVV